MHIDYREVDVEAVPAERDRLLGMGFREMPVVDADGDMWSGYRVDRLASLSA
jgi:glutaredoxin-like protein NrdH